MESLGCVEVLVSDAIKWTPQRESDTMLEIIKAIVAAVCAALFGPPKATVAETLGKVEQERDHVAATLNDVKAAETVRVAVAAEPTSVRDSAASGFFRD
jgi:hypothetical protein